MKKVLIAVDDTKGSKAALLVFFNFVVSTAEVILLHVEKLEGRSLMIDMFGEAELSTLKESLKGTEYKESLDIKADKILDYYKRELETAGLSNIKTVMREGHLTDEILKVAEEEGAELIIVGYSRRRWLNKLFTGGVDEDVLKNAKVPVLAAKRFLIYEDTHSWSNTYSTIVTTAGVLFGLLLLSMFVLGIILEKNEFLP